MMAARVVVLPDAGRAGDQDEAARFLRQATQRGGQPQFLEAGDGGGENPADGDTHRAPLLEDVGSEAAEAGDGIGEINLAELGEPLGLLLVHQGIGGFHRIGGREALKPRS